MKDYDAILIIGNSEENADLYWATGFKSSDNFIFIQTKKDKILVINCLEIERARKESKATKFMLDQIYWEKMEKKVGKAKYGNLPPYLRDVGMLDLVFKELGISKILVPSNDFSFAIGKALEKRGYKLIFKGDVFYLEQEMMFKQRAIKTEEEIGYISEIQGVAEIALKKTLKIIRNSEIKNGFLYHKGKILTSEEIKKIISLESFKRECLVKDIVVSCGKSTSLPHNMGTGPLKACQPIVIDVDPQSIKTGYFADMTRTVVRGKASEKLRKMYYAVLEGQKIALGLIKEGASGDKIHKAVKKYFTSQGFKTSLSGDPPHGLIHGIGHGLGLEIHEYPHIMSGIKNILKAGNVIAVEPGLYYPDIGGVRIEDLVVVTKDGYKNLTKFPKEEFEL